MQQSDLELNAERCSCACCISRTNFGIVAMGGNGESSAVVWGCSIFMSKSLSSSLFLEGPRKNFFFEGKLSFFVLHG